MVQIIIQEITGSGQVVGPNITQNFITSGTHSGDNITVNATGAPVNVSVDIVDSGLNVAVTGQATVQSISVSVQEAVYQGDGPFTTRFYYDNEDKLVLKNANSINTSYTYNLDGTLYQISNVDFTKTFLYDSDGLLTGFDVT